MVISRWNISTLSLFVSGIANEKVVNSPILFSGSDCSRLGFVMFSIASFLLGGSWVCCGELLLQSLL